MPEFNFLSIMKKSLILLLSAVALSCMAQEHGFKTFSMTDTLYVNDEFMTVDASQASMFGIFKRIEEENNVATIQFFDLQEKRLVAIEKRGVSGADYNLKKGKQLYFSPDGKVERMEVYTIYRLADKSKAISRQTSETYLYPDGKNKEEVTITYEDNGPEVTRRYERRCFYPTGELQYEEKLTDEGFKYVYYNKKGKKVRNPKQEIVPYMTMPEFPGGQEALFRFLSNTVKYPLIAQENRIQGRVVCQFFVNPDGTIDDISVLRSGGDPSLDREAVRVIKCMPKWKPGTVRGKPVRVKYSLPVNFILQ